MPEQTRDQVIEGVADPDAATPGDWGDDVILRDLYARLPHGYDFDGHSILRVISSGRARQICGPVIVRAQARTAAGAGWCAQIVFRSRDGTWQTTIAQMRDLLNAPARVASGLIDRGFELRGRPKDLCDYLLAVQVDQIGEALEGTGWVNNQFDAFICPSGQVVMRTGVSRQILFSGQPRVMEPQIAPDQRAQAAQTWITAIRAHEAPEAVMIGLCAAFAPVILPVRGDPSFLLHLHGSDAAGRISRTVAAGVWGPVAQLSLGWADPLPRILAAIEATRDGLVVLAGYQPRHHRKAAAVAEAMAAMDAAGRHRVVILSTGLTPVIASDPRSPISDGQDLRNVVDIDARAWDAEAANAIAEAAGTDAGVLGPQIMQSILNWRLGEKRTFLTIRIDDVLEVLTHEDVGPIDTETDHIARVFGALHGAGAVLELQKPPSGLDRSTLMFQRLFADWIAHSRGVLSAPERVLIGQTATAIRDLLRDGALTPLDTADLVVPLNEIGWCDKDAVYLSVATVTAIAARGGVSLDWLIDLLLSQSLLQHQQERGNQWRLPSRVPGRPRAYKIPRARILRYAAALPDPA
jgi:hypothetical protein